MESVVVETTLRAQGWEQSRGWSGAVVVATGVQMA